MKYLLVLFPSLALAVWLTLSASRALTTVDQADLAPAPLPPMAAPPLPPAPAADVFTAGAPTAVQLANGARVYRSLCVACHLPDGRGVAGVTPPLVASDYLQQDRERVVRLVLRGLSGPIAVNGVGYNGVMPPLGAVLTDRQVADVLTYVSNSWGNAGEAFPAEQVAVVRARSE